MGKKIIFDFDGVIADSFDVVYVVANEILRSQGMEEFRSEEELRDMYKTNFYESLREKGFSRARIALFVRKLQKILPERYAGVAAFEGIKEVLKRLSENNDLYLVSSNVRKVIEEFNEREDLNFLEVLGVEDGKSKVVKIKRVAEDSKEFYYVGDTLGDMIEGRKAGAKTVGVTWGYHSRDILEKGKPDFLVDKPEDLLELFQN